MARKMHKNSLKNLKGGSNIADNRFNPADGYTAKQLLKKEFREICKEFSPECAEIVMNIVRDKEVRPKDRIEGAELIMGYGFGKPKETFDINGDKSMFVYDAKALAEIAGVEIIKKDEKDKEEEDD